jgi:transcriptional regulator NrdR family protein
MKCPHCSASTKAKVMESRPHDGQVYRRRICGQCFKTFVSCEDAPSGLRMPNGTQSRHRITDRKPKPEETDGIIRSTGAHLQSLWR